MALTINKEKVIEPQNLDTNKPVEVPVKKEVKKVIAKPKKKVIVPKKIISFELEIDMIDKIDAIAKKEDRSASYIYRKVFEDSEYIKSYKL